MLTYVISSLKLDKKLEPITDKQALKLIERIITIPEDFTLEYRFLEDFGFPTFRITLTENVLLTYQFLPDPIETELITEILVVFRSLKNNHTLILGSSRGIGLTFRGPPRKYFDSIIGKIIEKSFFEVKGGYIPLSINQKQMRFENWGEKLKELTIDIENFGRITLTSQDLQTKIKSQPTLLEFINTGSIRKIKVFSNKLNRVVEVSNLGIVRVNDDNIERIGKYVVYCLKRR